MTMPRKQINLSILLLCGVYKVIECNPFLAYILSLGYWLPNGIICLLYDLNYCLLWGKNKNTNHWWPISNLIIIYSLCSNTWILSYKSLPFITMQCNGWRHDEHQEKPHSWTVMLLYETRVWFFKTKQPSPGTAHNK